MVDALFRHPRKVFTNKLFLQFYWPKDSVPTSHIDLANLDLRALASSVLNDKFLVFRTPNTKKKPSSDVPNLKVFSMWLQCHSKYERVRALASKNAILYFYTISKNNFITYTIPFYNSTHIKKLYSFTFSLKYYFLIFLYYIFSITTFFQIPTVTFS